MISQNTEKHRRGLAQRIRESSLGENDIPDTPPPPLKRPDNPPPPPADFPPEPSTTPAPSPSKRKRKKQAEKSSLTRAIVTRGSNYAELHRMRERIVSTLKEQNHSTILVTSPHDDAGNTFLISLLGYNAASFSALNVLLIDMNMRRPQLHLPFGLELDTGFAEVATGSINWRSAIKSTNLPKLKIITAGNPNPDLYRFLNRAFLDNLMHQIKQDFDLIMIDTSPVLNQNRNNVDPVLLSLICDMVLIIVQDKKTSKSKLENAVSVIAQGGGIIHGIIYNLQFHKNLPALLKVK